MCVVHNYHLRCIFTLHLAHNTSIHCLKSTISTSETLSSAVKSSLDQHLLAIAMDSESSSRLSGVLASQDQQLRNSVGERLMKKSFSSYTIALLIRGKFRCSYPSSSRQSTSVHESSGILDNDHRTVQYRPQDLYHGICPRNAGCASAGWAFDHSGFLSHPLGKGHSSFPIDLRTRTSQSVPAFGYTFHADKVSSHIPSVL